MRKKERLRIIFMGTPEFATTILKKLVEADYNIITCVTAPDKPSGRGRKIQESDVKKYALSVDLPVLQPTNLKAENFVSEINDLAPDLIVVVAFRMLPKVIWEIPSLGTINLHGSLLPDYRGAAPINWAIINGETKTGVTTFFINENIDTGDIILQEEMEIEHNDNAGTIHDRMMNLGAEVMVKTIEKIKTGNNIAKPQIIDEFNQLKPAPKLFKADCKITLTEQITTIYNFIRGLSPYPTAWINIKHKIKNEIKTLKIYSSSIIDNKSNYPISITEDEKQLILKLPNGTLRLDEIQLEGKKRLESKAFLTGFRAEEWEVLN